MSNSGIPRELIEGLNDEINPEDILHWIGLQSGINQKWGQSYLFITKNKFMAMDRKSFSDPWTFYHLNPMSKNAIRLKRYEESLIMESNGEELWIQVYDNEKPGLLQFLEKLNEVKSTLEIPRETTPAEVETDIESELTPPEIKKPLETHENSGSTIAEEGFISGFNELYEEININPSDPITDAIMKQVEKLVAKAESFGFGGDDDPFEKLGAAMENFFTKRAEAAANEGMASNPPISEKIRTLRKKVHEYAKARSGKSLSPNEENDFKTYLATAKLLAKRDATREQAINALKNALSLKPNSAVANEEIGDLLIKKGDVATAIKHFEKAVENEDDLAKKQALLNKIETHKN